MNDARAQRESRAAVSLVESIQLVGGMTRADIEYASMRLGFAFYDDIGDVSALRYRLGLQMLHSPRPADFDVGMLIRQARALNGMSAHELCAVLGRLQLGVRPGESADHMKHRLFARLGGRSDVLEWDPAVLEAHLAAVRGQAPALAPEHWYQARTSGVGADADDASPAAVRSVRALVVEMHRPRPRQAVVAALTATANGLVMSQPGRGPALLVEFPCTAPGIQSRVLPAVASIARGIVAAAMGVPAAAAAQDACVGEVSQSLAELRAGATDRVRREHSYSHRYTHGRAHEHERVYRDWPDQAAS
jgi:hypothetical protein